MSNVTPLRAPRMVRVDETDNEVAHRRSISIHCPGQDEMTMAARVAIAQLRDQATSGAYRAGESAAVILLEAARVGTETVFAPVDFRRLLRVQAALSLTIEAARAMERALSDGR